MVDRSRTVSSWRAHRRAVRCDCDGGCRRSPFMGGGLGRGKIAQNSVPQRLFLHRRQMTLADGGVRCDCTAQTPFSGLMASMLDRGAISDLEFRKCSDASWTPWAQSRRFCISKGRHARPGSALSRMRGRRGLRMVRADGCEAHDVRSKKASQRRRGLDDDGDGLRRFSAGVFRATILRQRCPHSDEI